MLITILFPENKDIHYIGGSEILPAPLDSQEENEAILNLDTEFKEEARKKFLRKTAKEFLLDFLMLAVLLINFYFRYFRA